MKNPIVAIQELYRETMTEMKKCTWPTRQELYESTVVVVSCLIIMSLFVTITDKLIELGIRAITGI
jgi:preprotein translocase subunit SecE